MKQVIAQITGAMGAQDLKWYHWAIIINWCFSLLIVTGEPNSMWMYLWTMPYFGASSWLLTKCPIRDTEE